MVNKSFRVVLCERLHSREAESFTVVVRVRGLKGLMPLKAASENYYKKCVGLMPTFFFLWPKPHVKHRKGILGSVLPLFSQCPLMNDIKYT